MAANWTLCVVALQPLAASTRPGGASSRKGPDLLDCPLLGVDRRPRGASTCSGERELASWPFPKSPIDPISRVALWNASNLKFGDEFLGELRVPLKVLRQSSPYEAW